MSSTTLTMPAAPPIPGWIPSPLDRMTVDEYEAMVASGAFKGRNRFHLINGYLVEKMTQNPPHTVADIRCGREHDRVIPRGWHVRPGNPIRISGRSEPEFDRCVARHGGRLGSSRRPDARLRMISSVPPARIRAS